ncbi:hypothetical protein C1H46_022767 [Malus baccata]|uniref:Uncharacterized protein n=1 Tax=Malus baccata TaxID=106549 RepID=A0A540LYK8_MALBA|nr:hypothetical protein C1H46_022767 [Malus baccata]
MHDDSLQSSNLSYTVVYSTHPNTTIQSFISPKRITVRKSHSFLLTTDEQQQEDIHATDAKETETLTYEVIILL